MIEENGNHVVEMNRAVKEGTAVQAIKTLDNPITGKVTIEARIKGGTGENANSKTRVMYVKNSKNQNVIGIALNWDRNISYGQIDENGKVTWHQVTGYKGGTWYKVTIDLDTTTGKYDLYINGNKYGTYDIMSGAEAEVAGITFSLHVNNPDIFFFDDVSISVPVEPVTNVSLPETVSVMMGEELQLVPVVEPLGSTVTMEWESLNEDIAIVDQNGKVTPVKTGIAEIRVIVKDELYGSEFEAQCSVLVEPKSYTLYYEDFEGIELGSAPEGWNITTNHQDDTVTVVEDNGTKVLAMSRKQNTISVVKEFSGETGLVSVEARVKPLANRKTRVFYIKNTLNKDIIKFVLYEDGSVRVNGTITGAAWQTNTWSVFKFNINTTKGTVDFYCDGIHFGTYGLWENKPDLSKVQFNMQNQAQDTIYIDYLKVSLSPAASIPEKLDLESGETVTLPVEYGPEDIDEISWESDNPDIAEVDNNGNITAKSAGTTTVRVTLNSDKYGTAYAECEVTVKVSIAEVRIVPPEVTLSVGEEKQLSIVTTPDGVSYERLEWTSSDTEVVTVDSNGKVTALSAGQADITVIVFQNAEIQVSDTITIIVEAAEEPVIPVTGIRIETDVTEVKAGESIQLTAITTPDNATFKGVEWRSSNPDIAMVDDNGVVTGVTSGEAIITAVSVQPSEYGVIEDSIIIKVTEADEPGEEEPDEEDPDEQKPGEDPGEEPDDEGDSDPAPTPKPTPAPTPEPEDLNDRIETETEADGTRIAKLPESALKDLENELEKEEIVTIKAGEGSSVQRFEAPAEILGLIAEGKTVELDYGNVRMSIPAKITDIDTLAAELGVSSLDEVTVKFEVKEVTEDIPETGENFGKPVKVFEFRFVATTEDGRTVEVKEFDNPVAVRVPVDESMAEPVIKGTRNIYRVDVTPPEYRYTYRDGNTYVAELKGFSRYALLDWSKTFDDVGYDHWAHDYVQAAAAKNITVGIGNNQFGSDQNITRAEFAVFIVKALNISTEDYKGTFTDIPEDVWYAPYVEAAERVGIVYGVGHGKFEPDSPITREQLVTMLMRAYVMVTGSDLDDEANEYKGSINYLKDAAFYSAESILAAHAKGILDGVGGISETAFEPKLDAERAQAVAMLIKVLDITGRL